MKADFAHVDAWIFDMDNTLYDANPHVFVVMKKLMQDYMTRHLGIAPADAMDLRDGLWHRHGSTLRGLMNEYDIDPHHFLRATHDIDLAPVPRCDTVRDRLSRLPGRKIVYTNSTRPFAEKMLAHLGLDAHFDGLFAIEDADFQPKPLAAPYSVFLEKYGVDPLRACMFEDSAPNLRTARDLGVTTVWICGGGEEIAALAHVQHRAETLKDWLVNHIP